MVVEAIFYVMIIFGVVVLNIRIVELKAQRDAYKEKLKTHLQGSWGVVGKSLSIKQLKK